LCFSKISMFSICFFENTKHFSKSLPNNFHKWISQKHFFKCGPQHIRSILSKWLPPLMIFLSERSYMTHTYTGMLAPKHSHPFFNTCRHIIAFIYLGIQYPNASTWTKQTGHLKKIIDFLYRKSVSVVKKG
jgi:hypothetical protein